MNAETEAAEMLIHIVGTGLNEMVRLTGRGALAAGRGAIALIGFLYAIKSTGSPKEIATNPGGMAIITVPKDKLNDFVKSAKTYPYFRFFTIDDPDYDDGFVDVCIKAEDVATAKRICEKIGIAYDSVQDMQTLSGAEADIASAENFEQAAERLKAYAIESPEEAFNRKTDKDLVRDEPYIICSRLNPDNYVKVMPEQATYRGKEYTKFTYTCFKDGKQASVYDDGRFDGRPADYWPNVRERVVRSAALPEKDLLYFRTEPLFEKYKGLYEGKAGKKIVELDANEAADMAIKPFIKELSARLLNEDIYKEVPVITPVENLTAGAKEPTQEQKASGNGQEDGKTQKVSTMPRMMSDDESFYHVKDTYQKLGIVKSYEAHSEFVANHDFKIYNTAGELGVYGEVFNNDKPKIGDKFYFTDYEHPMNYIECVAHKGRRALEPGPVSGVVLLDGKESKENIIESETIFIDFSIFLNGKEEASLSDMPPKTMGAVFRSLCPFKDNLVFQLNEAFSQYLNAYQKEKFRYGGKKFIPEHDADAKEGSWISREKALENTASEPDANVGLSDYDMASFYDAATKQASLFYCPDTGKVYMPQEDGLHEYIKPASKEMGAEKLVEKDEKKGGVKEYVKTYKESHKQDTLAEGKEFISSNIRGDLKNETKAK